MQGFYFTSQLTFKSVYEWLNYGNKINNNEITKMMVSLPESQLAHKFFDFVLPSFGVYQGTVLKICT